MTDTTFHVTKEDIRKPESKLGGHHHGKTPANSNVSGLKSVIDKNTDKVKEIDERKANLPLPDQPPTASDWQSANGKVTGTGSGQFESPVSGENNSALRGPATAGSSVRVDGEEFKKETQPGSGVGRQAKDQLDDLPKDAQAR
ncbi:hypothetical protein DTO166G4_336 [Paecilomyces variotii]|uniref:Uncharacterized protein n=1 Tax=Byssochlamys spectabilis TaxID=264951 RepID=A0A443HVL9_BYSSP|nr:hypothetical protein C8Q69DRAFT_444691 [Paecilomyces variotii]KAJ9194735.1 hypothetical protein DTO164E3_7156 [Paecilomyces variotii]KAJ9217945.1 hypothetical protein DTO166G4_336 [Paecilomyces variotii]KAJ9226083.1 hypothetical protein DTO169C6_1722 [Paecilomyces variotii]KAJ9229659.1 hypothetical protein DTO166G5_7729 [Paecilomyces variotii]KAJ9240641.1 hypothetical protein DTO169E5_3973 [Paecilomyces variotii]